MRNGRIKETVREVLEAGGTLPINQMLRCRSLSRRRAKARRRICGILLLLGAPVCISLNEPLNTFALED
jgi:hypothetical protein